MYNKKRKGATEMTPGAVQGITRTLRTLVDGTLRLQVDFEPVDRSKAMNLFGEPSTSIALVVMDDEFSRKQMQKNFINENKKPSWRKVIFQSSFFRTPEVWWVMGSDEEFLIWIRTQKCKVCKTTPSEAAHVRRVANGAGTGIKPMYSAVPLCRTHHAEQHQEGENAAVGREVFDKWRIEAVHRWCWYKMKKEIGCESMKDISLSVFYKWLFSRGLTDKLSNCVQDKLEEDD